MIPRNFVPTIFLVISTFSFSQVPPVPVELEHQRLELARQYLLAAGIQAPDALDTAHISQLRSVLRIWIDGTSPALQSPASGLVSSDQSAAPQGSSLTPSPEIKIGAFYPRTSERIERLLQFKAEGVEQSRTIQFGSPPKPVMNPDHVLYKFSLVGDFSQLFLTSSDVSSIYTSHAGANEVDGNGAFQAYGREVPTTYQMPTDQYGEGPCRQPKPKDDTTPSKFIDCLRRVTKKGIVERAFSGVTATLSYSQNPSIQQNLLVPKGSQNFFSGEVLFDPTKYLFPTGTDWKSVVAALNFQKVDPKSPQPIQDEVTSRNTLLLKRLRAAIADECGVTSKDHSPPEASELHTSDCLLRLAGRRGKLEIAAAMIPIFDYKVQTNFDYYKNGGSQFVPNPFPENHLWDFTFTTDLRKIISTVQSRADASSALKAYFAQAGIMNPPPAEQNMGTCVLPQLPNALSGTFFSYALDDEGQTQRKWKLKGCLEESSVPKDRYKKAVCTVRGLAVNGTGLLSGYPDQAGPITLNFHVSKSNGAFQECSALLNVGRSPALEANARLLLDYLELAADPGILLDEPWFAEFKQVVAHTLFAEVERAKSNPDQSQPNASTGGSR